MNQQVRQVKAECSPAQRPIKRIAELEQWPYAIPNIRPPGMPRMKNGIVDNDVVIIELKCTPKQRIGIDCKHGEKQQANNLFATDLVHG